MPLEYCHCIVILLLFIVSLSKIYNCHIFIVLASDILLFLSSDCFTMMSYWYCVSIVYACHLKLAFVNLLYLYLLCEHSITPCGLNKVYLILSYQTASHGVLTLITASSSKVWCLDSHYSIKQSGMVS